MIVVRISMIALPEKQLEIKQTLLSMIDPMLRKSRCTSYAVLGHIENQNRFSIIGEWETREDLDNYFSSHRFGILLGTRALLTEPIKIQIDTVIRTENLDAIELARSNKPAVSHND